MCEIYGNIHTGTTCLNNLKEEIQKIDPPKIAVITTVDIIDNCMNRIKTYAGDLFNQWKIILVENGEKSKSISTVAQVWKVLVKENFCRNSLIISLGGGTVTDLAGFAASTYMRGIHLIHIPTTMLGQIDAAIGGKNAIDHNGKNTVGTFYNPDLVFIDPVFLETLPDNILLEGISEGIKTGIIYNRDIFNYFNEHFHGIVSLNMDIVSKIIKMLVYIKFKIMFIF